LVLDHLLDYFDHLQTIAQLYRSCSICGFFNGNGIFGPSKFVCLASFHEK